MIARYVAEPMRHESAYGWGVRDRRLDGLPNVVVFYPNKGHVYRPNLHALKAKIAAWYMNNSKRHN